MWGAGRGAYLAAESDREEHEEEEDGPDLRERQPGDRLGVDDEHKART